MSDNEQRLREALARIAEVASAAVNGEDYPAEEDDGGSEQTVTTAKIVCTPKALPKNLLTKAADLAVENNPVNAPALTALASVAPDLDLDRLAIAVLTTKYWGPGQRTLTVSFLDGPAADLRRRMLTHLNAWNRAAGIRFVETSRGGQVRISRGAGGYWSYLGTDILLIRSDRPTMNLQGFTMNTPESEFKRVIRHEAGHTLGFPHEHMRQALVNRIDPQKAYAYFLRTQGWDKRTVDQQVLTPLDERSLMSTPADQTSIMCYQLPASITRDGRPILGGADINSTDFDFAGRIYPKAGRTPSATQDEAAEYEEEDIYS